MNAKPGREAGLPGKQGIDLPPKGFFHILYITGGLLMILFPGSCGTSARPHDHIRYIAEGKSNLNQPMPTGTAGRLDASDQQTAQNSTLSSVPHGVLPRGNACLSLQCFFEVLYIIIKVNLYAFEKAAYPVSYCRSKQCVENPDNNNDKNKYENVFDQTLPLASRI